MQAECILYTGMCASSKFDSECASNDYMGHPVATSASAQWPASSIWRRSFVVALGSLRPGELPSSSVSADAKSRLLALSACAHAVQVAVAVASELLGLKLPVRLPGPFLRFGSAASNMAPLAARPRAGGRPCGAGPCLARRPLAPGVVVLALALQWTSG